MKIIKIAGLAMKRINGETAHEALREKPRAIIVGIKIPSSEWQFSPCRGGSGMELRAMEDPHSYESCGWSKSRVLI